MIGIIISSLFFLLCISCSKETSWHSQRIKTGHSIFDSTRLSYHTKDKINGIDIQIIQTKDNAWSYLQVHSQKIPMWQKNPHEALVKIISKEKTFRFIVPRHQGGQRLFLTEEIQTILMDLLKNNVPITIELEGYRELIISSSFK